MKKIGLFGGTFDPIHTGHLIIAQAVFENTDLDTVIFIPSASPPHKSTDVMFSAEQRSRMISLAIEGNPHFEISDIEMNRKGPSYTIDTIYDIKEAMKPDSDLSFIVGRDNLYEICTWKDPYAIVEECRILVADRPGIETGEIPDWLGKKVELVKAPLIEISSSDIRSRIREGKSIRYLVPDPVADVIEKEYRIERKKWDEN